MRLRTPARYAGSVGLLFRSYPLKNHLPCLLPSAQCLYVRARVARARV